jgi:hypothetical protein
MSFYSNDVPNLIGDKVKKSLYKYTKMSNENNNLLTFLIHNKVLIFFITLIFVFLIYRYFNKKIKNNTQISEYLPPISSLPFVPKSNPNIIDNIPENTPIYIPHYNNPSLTYPDEYNETHFDQFNTNFIDDTIDLNHTNINDYQNILDYTDTNLVNSFEN